MTALQQSLAANAGFLNGALAGTFQNVCQTAFETTAPGFSSKIYTETCSAVTAQVASSSRIDLAIRATALCAGMYCFGNGCYCAAKAGSFRQLSS
jgi:hypothetical protein